MSLKRTCIDVGNYEMSLDKFAVAYLTLKTLTPKWFDN